MPNNIKHILKIWGKGGVEDYITSLLATKIDNQQVVLCSQFSFFRKEKNYSNHMYVFHTPSYIWPILFLKLRRIPYKIILHNEPFRGHLLKDLYFFLLFIFHSVLRSKIFVWTESMKNTLKKYFINVSVLPMFNQEVSHPINYKNDKNIIFVARNDPQKNIQLLKDIAYDNDDFIFNIYGSGFTDSSFKMHKNIKYKGYIEEKSSIYNKGILLCTSNYEGGPLVSLEALSYGIPVITTRVGVFKNMEINTKEVDFINVFETRNEANMIIDLYRKKENFTSDCNKQFLKKNFLNPSQVINEVINRK